MKTCIVEQMHANVCNLGTTRLDETGNLMRINDYIFVDVKKSMALL